MDEYVKSNKALWNDWTLINARSADYDLEGFKQHKNSLHPLELGEVGDVSGKSLLHLQCHFGKDTLSWAQLGANVTGVDFSENAIDLARSLSAELEIPANFVLSDLYRLPEVLEGEFDIVFTSYGVLGWLPDIELWGKIVAHYLKPGGTFYIAEVHPFVWIFDDSGEPADLKVIYSYFHKEPLRFDVKGSYADPDADYVGVEYGWNHTLSDYINALIGAGLQIEHLHEFPFLGWKALPFMEEHEDGLWYLPEGKDKIPLLFSLKATKPKDIDTSGPAVESGSEFFAG
ncbi:MAG TPA: class I SAM-dependent methyltransferase [Chloroflexia bacterium]|nr:class I SAM-dependent methyltransferase [Chloroflexia bacterium]